MLDHYVDDLQADLGLSVRDITTTMLPVRASHACNVCCAWSSSGSVTIGGDDRDPTCHCRGIFPSCTLKNDVRAGKLVLIGVLKDEGIQAAWTILHERVGAYQAVCQAEGKEGLGEYNMINYAKVSPLFLFCVFAEALLLPRSLCLSECACARITH